VAASFETVLGCDSKAARARLTFLGITETCGRCGGSGRYSYNQMDGDRCYGCNGKGKRVPRFTKKLGARVAELVAGGALETYFARGRAIAAARREIAPLVAKAHEVYQTIGATYTVGADWSRSTWGLEDRPSLTDSPLFRAQTMNNEIRRAVWNAEWSAKHGQLCAERAVALLREYISDLETLRDAWLSI
jgi:hypothetical protein